MAYRRSQRTTLKRRATYGRGTRRYAQSRYRRAYFNKRRGVMRKEKKGCDVSFTNTPISSSNGTNAGIWLLNGVQEGVGSWNRIGRYIWNKSVELDLELDWLTSNTATDSAQTVATWVRCTVVWDKQPNNGTIPNFDTPSAILTRQEWKVRLLWTISDTITCSASKSLPTAISTLRWSTPLLETTHRPPDYPSSPTPACVGTNISSLETE